MLQGPDNSRLPVHGPSWLKWDVSNVVKVGVGRQSFVYFPGFCTYWWVCISPGLCLHWATLKGEFTCFPKGQVYCLLWKQWVPQIIVPQVWCKTPACGASICSISRGTRGKGERFKPTAALMLLVVPWVKKSFISGKRVSCFSASIHETITEWCISLWLG